MSKLKAVDFFCGGGGMTCGMKQAGITVLAGLDNDRHCEETYVTNHQDTRFLLTDITKANIGILSDIGIAINDNELVFIGCSPCQHWSIINTDRRKSEKSINLLAYFQKFVKHYNPGYVVIENVPGIKRFVEKSKLNTFIRFLSRRGYSFDDGVINANDYGVPQSRRRYVLIASRVNQYIRLPLPDQVGLVVRDVIGHKNGFKKISAGHIDKTDFKHSCSGLNEISLKRFYLTPKNGGTRKSWSKRKDLQINAYQGRDHCFRDVYGRMAWEKPAPTITTRFNSISNGRFGHPDEDRAISLREGATLQTFPHSYLFCSDSISTVAKLIGNAVPPELARRLALALQVQEMTKTEHQP
ncbi:MAG: DNA cytosine methyltransferase [Nitrospira sp.]|nr:DNA cytosine methyltransferase [Nitrospira sp.]